MKKGKAGALAPDLPTDPFSSWLRRTRQAQKTKKGAVVPCGECRACCTSAYFIHISPDETETLARIPKQFVFAAPGLPKGHVVLGYDKNGHCPMFIDNQCSIYEHRPHTCRTYDCRVFPAAGLTAGQDKPAITRQAKRWRFTFSSQRDHDYLRAVQAAAKFLREYAESFPPGFVPINPTQQAVVALNVYDVFLRAPNVSEDGDSAVHIQEMIEAIVAAYERDETKRKS